MAPRRAAEMQPAAAAAAQTQRALALPAAPVAPVAVEAAVAAQLSAAMADRAARVAAVTRGSSAGFERTDCMTYRMFDATESAPEFTPPANDLSPAHVPYFQSAPNVVVVLIGDSISTYNANSVGRSDGLAFMLEQFFRDALAPGQTLTFHNRAVGGALYETFLTSAATSAIAPDLTWWIDGKTWFEQVRDLGPHILVSAFGMNDKDQIRPDVVASIIDQCATWPSAPDLVLCTNLQPSFADGQRAPQDGRDQAAGVTRTMAKQRGVGLLDFHRQFCAARDAFDPCEATLRNVELAGVLATDRRSCPEETIDFMVEFDVNLDALVTDLGADKVIVRIGSLPLDWLRVSRTAGPFLRVELSTGPGAHPLNYLNQTLPWLGGGVRTLRVEISGDLLALYDPSSGGPEGQNQAPIFASKVVRGGGWFTPYVMMVNGAADIDATVTNVSFWTARQCVHRPRITDGELFQGAAGEWEGSTFNHPGNKVGSHIYAPVLAQARARA
jgi:hypothetical protein